MSENQKTSCSTACHGCSSKKMSYLFGAAIVAALAIFGVKYLGGSKPALAEVAVGAAAPDVAFTDITGTAHKISDFKGKTVVLEWTNPGCPFVKKFYDKGDMPKIQEQALAKGDVVWIAVNSSAEGKEGFLATDEEAKKLVADQNIKATAYVRDVNGEFGKAYGAKTTPHMFVIDAEGKLAYQGAIDSVKSFDQADIAKAENYVLKAIDELRAGKPVTTTSTEAYGCSVKY